MSPSTQELVVPVIFGMQTKSRLNFYTDVLKGNGGAFHLLKMGIKKSNKRIYIETKDKA